MDLNWCCYSIQDPLQDDMFDWGTCEAIKRAEAINHEQKLHPLSSRKFVKVSLRLTKEEAGWCVEVDTWPQLE